jgi:anti-sigma B factor antagonist
MAEREFSISADDGPTEQSVVRVGGEIDVATAPQVEEALAGPIQAGKRVVLDLTECVFIDSAGLRTLLGARSAADSAGGSLVLVVSEPGLLRVFEVVGLGGVLEIHDTLAGALS